MNAKGKADLKGEAKKSELLQKKLDDLQSFELEHEQEKVEDSSKPKKKTIHDLEDEARKEMSERQAGLGAMAAVSSL